MAGADVTPDDVTEEPLVASYRQRGPTPRQPEVFITKGVDVLAINLVDPASASSIIEKAKKA